MTTEIESGVVPTTKPKRGRKKAVKAASNNPGVLNLITALDFVLPAQRKTGTPTQQHCHIYNGWIAATNEVLTIATPIVGDAELSGTMHTHTLLEALKQCGEDFSVVRISDGAVSVRSGDFAGLVGCVRPAGVTVPGPDAACAPCGDEIKLALGATAVLAIDGAPDAILASVLLQANSAVSTNGAAMLEYWHGTSLPPGLMIPQRSAVEISKVKKPLVGFGYSPSSATFHFADGSFIKTQLYAANFPNYAPILDVQTNPMPLPDKFWHAVEVISKFSVRKQIHFEVGQLSAREFVSEKTTVKMDGLPSGIAFNVEYLLALRQLVNRVDIRVEGAIMYFFGTNVRGALRALQPDTGEISDDDIPF